MTSNKYIHVKGVHGYSRDTTTNGVINTSAIEYEKALKLKERKMKNLLSSLKNEERINDLEARIKVLESLLIKKHE
jgi:hypothetical protein